MLCCMFRASRHVPRGLAFTPATAHISTAPSCKDDPVKNDTNKKTFRRPQQEDLVDTRRNVRERIGERPRSAEIMTPLGLRAIRHQNRSGVSRESYQKATRALAQAHLRKLPWMSQYVKHPAIEDAEGYTVLGTVGRVVKDDSRSPAQGANANKVDLHQTMIADFTKVRGESVMQLNANRRYRVKDSYKAEDLNPYKREKAKANNRAAKISRLMHKGTLFDKNDRIPYIPDQVRRDVNFKNVSMLMHFTGRQGNILGRREEIPAVTQRKIARAVKNSRQMALMPHVGLHSAFPGPMAEALQDVFDHLEARAIAGQ